MIVQNELLASHVDTPLGLMLLIADSDYLYLLEFVDGKSVNRELAHLKKRFDTDVAAGETPITHQIKQELHDYFAGKSLTFNTHVFLSGTKFQQKVWRALQTIPPRQTRSYLDIAKAIGQPTACRAVANANGANQLAIIIPCHRVINASGALGGYDGGVSRKAWLLEHERGL